MVLARASLLVGLLLSSGTISGPVWVEGTEPAPTPVPEVCDTWIARGMSIPLTEERKDSKGNTYHMDVYYTEWDSYTEYSVWGNKYEHATITDTRYTSGNMSDYKCVTPPEWGRGLPERVED